MSSKKLTASSRYALCKQFAKLNNIDDADISKCARELVQELPRSFLEIDDPDIFKERLNFKYLSWVRNWRKRQNGTFYGKYARLADKVTESGVIFNPQVFRVRMAYQVLRGVDYSKAPHGMFTLSRDILRVLKLRASRTVYNPLRILSQVICKDIAIIKPVYDVAYTASGRAKLKRLEDVFVNANGGSWRSTSIKHLTPELRSITRSLDVALRSCDKKLRKTDVLSETLIACSAADRINTVKSALQRFGYANTIIFLADFGSMNSFSTALIQRCKEASALLRSENESDVNNGLQLVDGLVKEARAEFSQLRVSALKHTCIFG